MIEPQLENPNFVVHLIPRSIEQRSHSGVARFFEKADRVLARAQFLAISRLKFFLLRRIISYTFVQLTLRRVTHAFTAARASRSGRGLECPARGSAYQLKKRLIAWTAA